MHVVQVQGRLCGIQAFTCDQRDCNMLTCLCNVGHTWNQESCQPCQQGFYCGSAEPVRCPIGETTVGTGSWTLSQCYTPTSLRQVWMTSADSVFQKEWKLSRSVAGKEPNVFAQAIALRSMVRSSFRMCCLMSQCSESQSVAGLFSVQTLHFARILLF